MKYWFAALKTIILINSCHIRSDDNFEINRSSINIDTIIFFLNYFFLIKSIYFLRRYQYEISSSYISGRHHVQQLYVSSSTQEKKSRIRLQIMCDNHFRFFCTLLNTYTHRWGKKKRSSSQRCDIIHLNEIKRLKHKWWFFHIHRRVSCSALFFV